MLPLILIVPVVCAMLTIAGQKEPVNVKYIALGGSLLGLLLLPFIGYGAYTIRWFAVGQYTITITTLVTPVNMLLLAIILLITPVILLYSFGFIDVPSEQRRYYIEMLAFETAMITFAMSGNFIIMFMAWEFLSLTSYLLIGFYSREKAVKAARRALTIIFIGDIALLLSIILFFNLYHTLEFSSIIYGTPVQTPEFFSLAVAMLGIAIFTKSAQFPFQEWLIDAMEGPTPVSAYLHSTTMVKAGVFALILLFPLFRAAGFVTVITIVAAITAVLATFNAMRERHIKKIIAYSTIQELSLMLIAVSSNALVAGIYFFFAQSFYKALLFFSSGAMMKATDKENVDEISGLGSNKLVYISTLYGVLALAGFVPFDGFLANVALSSSINNFYIYVLLSLISMMTSFYIFRWFFFTKKDAKSASVAVNYEALPRSMVYSMAIMAASTIVASFFFGFILNLLLSSQYYNYVANSWPAQILFNDALIFTALIAIGLLLSYLVYGKRKIKVNVGALDSFIYTNWLFNMLYSFCAGVMSELAEGAAIFDSHISDAFDRIGRMTVRTGFSIRKISVGEINLYTFLVMSGILFLLGYLYFVVR